MKRHPPLEREFEVPDGRLHTVDYLAAIGVDALEPASCPFDPGYDPATFEGHLIQSSHLMETMKISMACWQIADEAAMRWKVAACDHYGVATTTGGGPFEVAVQQGRLDMYLDLVADMGIGGIEAGEGFTEMPLPAGARGGDGRGSWPQRAGRAWQEARGHLHLRRHGRAHHAGPGVVGCRRRARGHRGPRERSRHRLLKEDGRFRADTADRFAEVLGLETCLFEAPTKPSQFALLDHFGPAVHLCNIRLEELLRVEIYRRGLHSDAFQQPALRPPPMTPES